MEALCYIIEDIVEGGFLASCQVTGKGASGVDVSHLLVANDILFFF